MKKIALFILILFTTVQVWPAMLSFFNDGKTIVFNVDEEKSNGKIGADDHKEKKDYTSHFDWPKEPGSEIITPFHLSESIVTSPCLEKLTPPPNFC